MVSNHNIKNKRYYSLRIILLVILSLLFINSKVYAELYIDSSDITVSAHSSGSYPSSLTADGSGLDQSSSYHSNNAADTWISAQWPIGSSNPSPLGTTGSAWIAYTFDQVYSLGNMWIWNYNTSGATSRGLRNVSIYYTDDGASWIKLDDYELPPATGGSQYYSNFIVNFNGINASSVAIIAQPHASGGNWGAGYYGLSEVKFYLEQQDHQIVNYSFEDPIVTDGGSSSGVVDWGNYIWPGWVGPETKNPDSSTTVGPDYAMDGDNYAYIDAGGIRQELDVRIESETVYTLTFNIASVWSGPWYDLRLRCDQRNEDLAVTDNYIIPFASTNHWGTTWLKWDSTGSPYVGEKLQIWIKGSYLALDNVILTSTRADHDLAYDPYPSNDAIGMSQDTVLSWSPGEGSQDHKVYLGTDYDAVLNANEYSDQYQGSFDSNSFDPCGLSKDYCQYYWRVDEFDGSVTHKGNVWTFTTAAPQIRQLNNDAWTVTDALGRSLSGYAQCGQPRENRFVGIFNYGGSSGFDRNYDGLRDEDAYNSTETLANPAGSFSWTRYYWAEPELGYYVGWDEYVVRKHCQMFTDAGIDVIIVPASVERAKTICRIYQKMRAEGENTPQIAFFIMSDDGGAPLADEVYNEFYVENLFPELWFYWKDKPLMLSQPSPATLSSVVQSFFTLRQCWAWTDGYDTWSWLHDYPQPFGWHDSFDRPEAVSVAVASHPTRNMGRSFSGGSQPAYDQYHLTAYTDQGLFFSEQWSRALEIDPEFIFITQWNEWISGCYQGNGETYFLGHLTNPSDPDWYYYFVDMYNQEYSRDIEPMKDGHTDNYYYQMVDYIRQYKGIETPLTSSDSATIIINGDFTDWNDIEPEYRDTFMDTFHRNEKSAQSSGVYINTTGRNDFVTLKVARDNDYIYFYAETADNITNYTDPNWMLLFIDTDQDYNTGWQGYDYLVNYNVVDSDTTTLMQTSSGWNWTTVNSNINYNVLDNKLELRIPRSDIGQDADDVIFDFHWADNIQQTDDIIEFAVSGDSAPNRRFNYRYDTSLTQKACDNLFDSGLGEQLDLDENCYIDFEDLLLLTDSWVNSYDFVDYSQLAENWLVDYTPQTFNADIMLSDDAEGDMSSWLSPTSWTQTQTYSYSPSSSLFCQDCGDNLVSQPIDLTGKASFKLSFRYRTGSGLTSYDNTLLQFYNGISYDTIIELSDYEQNVWRYYTITVYNQGVSSYYFINDFSFRIEGTGIDYNGEFICIDDVILTATE